MNHTLLRECISLILIEGRVEDAKRKYPKFEKQVDFFVEHEPKGSKSKYLDWELKVLDSGKALEREISDVVNLFDKYSSNLKKKDINSYTVQEFTKLRDQLFNIRDKRSGMKEKEAQRYHVEGCEADVIYEDDEHRVLHIKNKAASVHYGLGAKWCISMKGEEYFEEYESNNVIFFFILSKIDDQSDPLYKIAVSVERNLDNKITNLLFWDAEDAQIQKQVVAEAAIGDEALARKIFDKIESVAANQPRSLLATVGAGEGTAEECDAAAVYILDHPDLKDVFFGKLASNENISQKTLERFAADEDDSVRAFVAGLIEAPDMIELFSDDGSPTVLDSLCMNPHAPVSILQKLSTSRFPSIRGTVPENPNTPIILSKKLARDPDSRVRRMMAGGKLPEAVLKILVKDESEDVRISLARNVATSPSILADLAEDPVVDVRVIVSERGTNFPSTLAVLGRDSEYRVRTIVARNNATPRASLEKLSEDPSPAVRREIIFNPFTPKAVVEKMSKSDPSETLRMNARELLDAYSYNK